MNCVDIETLLKKQNQLQYDESSQVFTGYLQVGQGDRYLIKMDIKDFPTIFPKVFEIGERIKQIPDYHINSDGSCCFTTPPLQFLYLSTEDKTLTNFVDKIVIPYFLNNSHREQTGHYLFGEYSHNYPLAICQTYEDLLGIESPLRIVECINNYCKGKALMPHQLCYCGSKQKMSKCFNHADRYKKMRMIPKRQLLNDSYVIETLTLDIRKFLTCRNKPAF